MLIISVVTTVLFLFSYSTEAKQVHQSCDFPDTVHCADQSKCIHVSDICDFIPDCPDSSDENPDFCLQWPRTLNCGLGHVMCMSPENYVLNYCITLSEACRKGCSEMPSLTSCKIVESKQLPLNGNQAACSSSQNTELFQFLTDAFAGNTKNKTDGCPSLYRRVKDSCFSMFRPAKVTWEEAKLFCESIGGELAVLDDIISYNNILQELKDTDGDFWIGGHFSNGNWTWTNGEQVQMGSPFWGLYRATGLCDTEDCQKGIIMPRSNTDGQCIALTSTHHHYFSDEGCFAKKSPLCMRQTATPGASSVEAPPTAPEIADDKPAESEAESTATDAPPE